MKTRLVLTYLLASTTLAYAEFRASPPPAAFDGGNFECSIVRERPPARDRDPVYKININVTINDSGKLASIGVVHTARSGKTYDRSQQYSGGTIWKTPDRMEWYWQGFRGPIKMVGEIYNSDRDGWMYQETIFNNGRIEYQMLADCHQQGPNDSLLTAPSSSALAGYDNTWFVSAFWSGEYPAGFSVTREHVTLMARSAMDKSLSRTVPCEMPYLAVIHPWNTARNQKSDVRFSSASKIVNLIAKEDFDFISNQVRFKIRKNDIIQYLRNDAEGAFEVRINGKQYTASQDMFDHVQDVSSDQFVEDDWALLTCVNGGRAYIYLPDVAGVPGINDVGPGMVEYGKARDLTVREAQKLG